MPFDFKETDDADNYHSIVGSALVYATSSIGSRYAGLLLMGIYSAAMPISMAMISSNVGGFTKKATVSSIYFIMYCTGNIIGPQLFFEREAPKYQVKHEHYLKYLIENNVDNVTERIPGHNHMFGYSCG